MEAREIQTELPQEPNSPAAIRARLWGVYTGALKRYPLPGGIVARSIQRTDTGWVASEPCALNTAEVLKAAFLLDSVGVSHGVNAHELLNRLVAEHIEGADYQVVALTLWAASVAHSSHAANLLRILPGRIPADASQSMPLAWALSAVCAYAESHDARDANKELVRRLADRLLTNQDSSTGLFYSSARRVGFLRRRNADATLSTQTYPILALSHYARVFEMPALLPSAQSCADRECALQGAEGQWWRRYDARRGRVLQDYPVYAVNQDAALPAALGALQRALGDRRYDGPIGRGLQWECGSNEVGKTLVDAATGFVAQSLDKHGDSYQLSWEMYAYQPARCLFALVSDPLWFQESTT